MATSHVKIEGKSGLRSTRAAPLTMAARETTSDAPNAGETVAFHMSRRRRSNRPGNSQAKGPRGQVLWRAADGPCRSPKGVSPVSRPGEISQVVRQRGQDDPIVPA